MGIFDALNTSVAGMQAQSFALQNISGNIANSQTTAFKGIGTSFEDLVPDATSPERQVAGGVTAFAQATITTQGTISTSTVSTNMAINGDGFFSVQKSTGTVDNSPVFSGDTDYTRRGDFQLSANGNLVNAAGYYLMGVAVDPKSGNPLGSVPTVLQFQNNFIPAQETTAVNYAANLPTTPSTAGSASAAAGTITAVGGLNPADFGTNPLTVQNATVSGTPVNNHNTTPAAITNATALSGATGTDSISSAFAPGDTITVNGVALSFVASGATGNQLNVTDTVGTLLTKIGNITGVAQPAPSGTGAITLNTGTATDLTITSNNASAMGALGFGTLPVAQARAANPSPGVITANDISTFQSESIAAGAVTAFDQTGTSVNIQMRWAKVDSSALGGTHTDTWNLYYQTDPSAAGTQTAWVNSGTNFTFGSNGQLVSPTSSSITLSNVSVAGHSLGNLALNVGTGALTEFASSSGAATINTISQNGYPAGQLQSVAINNNGLVVGTFSNGQNINLASVTLSHFNGTNYLKSLDGGAYAVTNNSGPAITGASGSISGSSLEGSNTDIANEFTKLIVTQQAYSANTKVITTANTMVQDLLNVLR